MKTILVIEDDIRVRENIQEILELEGFDALVAGDGRSGLVLARDTEPDLVICDVMMPELDGYGVLSALRDHDTTVNIPFIFLTAKASRHDMRHGMELGADDYLTKPFTPDELRRAVSACLLKYQRQQGAKLAPTWEKLDREIRDGIARDEFVLFYQPQVSLTTGQVIGAEALVRWQHPERGFVSPGEFIPAAEASGAIVPLGTWVMRTACQQARQWHDQGKPVRVSVNLAAQQVTAGAVAQELVDIAAETGFDLHWLDVELTETSLLTDRDRAIAVMQRLREIGVAIAIDDFGTGYSSLKYLQRFPFDILKIDRCFVENIDSNPGNRAIVTAIIQMSHDLNLQVIAEGIETVAELNILRAHHCDAIQGYLFSRPLPAEAFAPFLDQSPPLPGMDT